jgi:nitrate reductase delta subunit
VKALLEELAELLRYPGADNGPRLAAAIRLSQGQPCHAHLTTLGAQIRDLPISELQELYTRTFDLNPLCALEAGWQLYGEDYARGSFLAYLRIALNEHPIEERGELPDHLSNVLSAIARMPNEKAEELREGAAMPAVEKMLRAFEGKSNPYEHLLRAVAAAVRAPLADPLVEACHV